jgi:hypothetical protein
MKRLLVLTHVIWFSTIFTFSSDPGKPDLFPEIKGWDLVASEKVYGPSDLWDLIDGAADTYLSYSFMDLHLADYINETGLKVRVELYRHNTFDNSFGIYAAERNPDYHFIGIGSEGYLEEGALNFLCGYYYVKLTSASRGVEAQNALVHIAGSIEENLGQVYNWPEIFQLFPFGQDPYSEHYIAENFLGFEFLHSAFITDYKIDEEEFQVFIIRTTTKEEALEMIGKYLEFTGQKEKVCDGQINIKIRDPYNGDIYLLLKGNMLAGIIGCENETVSEEYMNLLKSKLQRKEP